MGALDAAELVRVARVPLEAVVKAGVEEEDEERRQPTSKTNWTNHPILYFGML